MYKSKDRNKELNWKDYLEAARERLRNAKVLLDAEVYPDSVSRSYFAMLNAIAATLITKNIKTKSHDRLIRLFHLHFIKTNLVDPKYIKWFKRIKEEREEGYYKHEKISKESAQEIYLEILEFVKMIEKLFPKLLKGGDI